MQKVKHTASKVIAFCMAIVMMLSVSVTAFAADLSKEGTYDVDASLSCYVNAMGGVEFGNGLLKNVQVVVDADGNMTAKVYLTKSQVTIYTVTCDTFVDATNSQPGFYTEDGTLNKEDMTYTLSEDTALNPSSEDTNYVDSLSFPLSSQVSTVTLYLYVNSNVMGVQFCDGSGTAGSNNPDVLTKYTATLTIDWDSASKVAVADETKSASSNVVYEISEGYEVEIPQTITVDASTKKASYNVTAKSFLLATGAYVTVTAAENGTLTNGSETLKFTNTLADGKLLATGDKLAGEITVTSNATVAGTYTGTTDFTISHFSAE